mmetsp:Transcript_11564/g.38016  ORF Transcript_11564/g.38016 Transcript_11564/m.38016 type:complete len:278 (+) Transcript_11564:1-834(+)
MASSLLEEVTTLRSEVEKARAWFASACKRSDASEVASEFVEAIGRRLSSAGVDGASFPERWRRGLATLFVVDAALKKDDLASAVALLKALAPDRPATLLRQLGAVFAAGRPDERRAVRDVATNLVRVWTRRLGDSFPALADIDADDLFPVVDETDERPEATDGDAPAPAPATATAEKKEEPSAAPPLRKEDEEDVEKEDQVPAAAPPEEKEDEEDVPARSSGEKEEQEQKQPAEEELPAKKISSSSRAPASPVSPPLSPKKKREFSQAAQRGRRHQH